jgi:hypothetical protein
MNLQCYFFGHDVSGYPEPCSRCGKIYSRLTDVGQIQEWLYQATLSWNDFRHALAGVNWLPFRYPRCEEPGCDEEGCPCYLEPWGKIHSFYCVEHSQIHGFCVGCGQFWGGIESFDFGPGWCDNCALEFEDDYNYEDDYYDFDDNYPGVMR